MCFRNFTKNPKIKKMENLGGLFLPPSSCRSIHASCIEMVPRHDLMFPSEYRRRSSGSKPLQTSPLSSVLYMAPSHVKHKIHIQIVRQTQRDRAELSLSNKLVRLGGPKHKIKIMPSNQQKTLFYFYYFLSNEIGIFDFLKNIEMCFRICLGYILMF